jgi:hypothetical protein
MALIIAGHVQRILIICLRGKKIGHLLARAQFTVSAAAKPASCELVQTIKSNLRHARHTTARFHRRAEIQKACRHNAGSRFHKRQVQPRIDVP